MPPASAGFAHYTIFAIPAILIFAEVSGNGSALLSLSGLFVVLVLANRLDGQ